VTLFNTNLQPGDQVAVWEVTVRLMSSALEQGITGGTLTKGVRLDAEASSVT